MPFLLIEGAEHPKTSIKRVYAKNAVWKLSSASGMQKNTVSEQQTFWRTTASFRR
jgi:hypothetical protein